MTGFGFLASVTTVATLMTASLVSAAPVHSEAGLLFSKRGSFSGDGTYYNPGLGSCETVSTASQLIAALNAPQFGVYARPRDSPACFSCALVHGPKGSVKVEIVDTCPSCKEGSLDLSPAAFEHIADLSQGRVHITWDFVPCGDDNGNQSKSSSNNQHSTSTRSAEQAKATQKPHLQEKVNLKNQTPTPTPPNHDNDNANTNNSSNKAQTTSSTCQFESRCVDPGKSGKIEICVNGRIEQQQCAQGTVCKNEFDSILCTWA